LLDTGANGTGGIESELAEKLVRGGHAHSYRAARFLSISNDVSHNVFEVPFLDLEKHRTTNLFFHKSRDNRLGLRYLSRFNLTIDFPNKLLYVNEGKSFDKRDETDLSGLHLVRKSGQTVADFIDADSAAERSGLKNGDIVLTIDDLDAVKASLFDLRHVLCQENRTVHVTTERDGERHESTLELR
jgi:C-terminal processing protease CtpA/Prc